MMTLQDFENLSNPEDGYYAVWISGFFLNGKGDDQQRLFGFSGEVLVYTNKKGWEGINSSYPDWFEERDANSINISLLEVLPGIDELRD